MGGRESGNRGCGFIKVGEFDERFVDEIVN